MIAIDEDALICDLAETYQIYDYKQLPPLKVAVFSLGLKENSRIKMKIAGQSVPFETLILAKIADNLSTLVWFQTKDGQKGKNRPTMITDLLLGNKNESKDDIVVFHSGEEFSKLRNQLIVGGE